MNANPCRPCKCLQRINTHRVAIQTVPDHPIQRHRRGPFLNAIQKPAQSKSIRRQPNGSPYHRSRSDWTRRVAVELQKACPLFQTQKDSSLVQSLSPERRIIQSSQQSTVLASGSTTYTMPESNDPLAPSTRQSSTVAIPPNRKIQNPQPSQRTRTPDTPDNPSPVRRQTLLTIQPRQTPDTPDSPTATAPIHPKIARNQERFPASHRTDASGNTTYSQPEGHEPLIALHAARQPFVSSPNSVHVANTTIPQQSTAPEARMESGQAH
jgi:hypothetical protein